MYINYHTLPEPNILIIYYNNHLLKLGLRKTHKEN